MGFVGWAVTPVGARGQLRDRADGREGGACGEPAGCRAQPRRGLDDHHGRAYPVCALRYARLWWRGHGVRIDGRTRRVSRVTAARHGRPSRTRVPGLHFEVCAAWVARPRRARCWVCGTPDRADGRAARTTITDARTRPTFRGVRGLGCAVTARELSACHIAAMFADFPATFFDRIHWHRPAAQRRLES